jgi:CheY-like chemotaxis protein
METQSEQSAGRQAEILIVEDNFLTALQVGEMVRDCGYRVAGTLARLKRGLDLIAERAFDGAIVDIDLDGTYSVPLCTELDRRKVPFCFLTGYSSNIIPSEFRGIPLLTKPADREQLRSALTALLPERPLELEPQPQPSPDPPRGNQLLEALDEASWAALAPCLEWTVLTAGDYLEKRGTRPSHLTFPVAGAVSLEAEAGKRRIHVALIGREAMVGTSPCSTTSPFTTPWCSSPARRGVPRQICSPRVWLKTETCIVGCCAASVA